MRTVDIVGLLIPVTYFVFLAVETLWPAREFPTRRGWQWLGIAFLLVVGTLSTVVPLLIPSAWLEQHRLLDGTGLGVVGGALAGISSCRAFPTPCIGPSITFRRCGG